MAGQAKSRGSLEERIANAKIKKVDSSKTQYKLKMLEETIHCYAQRYFEENQLLFEKDINKTFDMFCEYNVIYIDYASKTLGVNKTLKLNASKEIMYSKLISVTVKRVSKTLFRLIHETVYGISVQEGKYDPQEEMFTVTKETNMEYLFKAMADKTKYNYIKNEIEKEMEDVNFYQEDINTM